MILTYLKNLFEKKEVFEAFTYVYSDGSISKPKQITGYFRWLKDITITGFRHKTRETKAFIEFQKENNLEEGQVWIFSSYIKK